jgi:homoserine dehydrogenase
VEIVAEVMGGVKPAYDFVKACLENGKSVCTSNKELVAKHGAELLEIAKQNKLNFLFEASVGGGIPIIRPLNQSLTADEIMEITGILNGTTNYILTQMRDFGSDFDTVLKEAQRLGYAERNPEADVEGYDACRKLAILSSLMSGKQVDFEQIYTEGITKVTTADFEYAKAAGMTIKLLASAKVREDGSVLAMVAPFMIGKEHPLAMVNDVFNAVLVTGNMLGDAMFYGKGAGKLATASAVVSDVVECARNQDRTLTCVWSQESAVVAPVEEVKNRFFVRFSADMEQKARELFADASFMKLEGKEECACFSELMTEKEFSAKCEALGEGLMGRIRLA